MSLLQMVGTACRPREQENFTLWLRSTKVNCEFNPGHAWHHYICDEKVWRVFAARSDCLMRIIKRRSIEPCVIQYCRKALSDYWFVIYNKDDTTWFWHHFSLLSTD